MANDVIRIRVIIPNSSEPFRAGQVEDRKSLAGPGVELDVVCLPDGPESIESAYDEAMAAPFIIQEVIRAEQEQFHAVSLDCAMDTVVRASRQAVSIPVASAGEASQLLALGLCRTFSIITVMEQTAECIRENLAQSGLAERVASVRVANIPVLQLDDHEAAYTAIFIQAKLAVEQDGAQAIVLGCTGMSAFAAMTQRELNLPVIDPAAAGIRLAESYVRMNLRPSRSAYGQAIANRIQREP
jgi:allantoin racemase